MDPVSALGVVGTAISLFDLTKTLVKDAYKIMDKGEVGGLVVHEKVARDLTAFTRQFEEWSPEKTDKELSEDEIALRSLSLKCSETARELLALLEPLKPKEGNGQPGKLESISIAGKAMMRKSEIEELAKRIEKYRDQMHFRAQAVLNQQNRDTIHDGFSTQQDNHADLLERIEQQKQDLERQNEGLQIQLSYLTDLVHISQGQSAGAADSRGSLEVLPAHREAFLKHLHFRHMNDRVEDIKPSHRETFEWIFQDRSSQELQSTWSDFPAWLRSGSGSYWIQGKPGAGKSTLTKFIDQHPTTRSCLNQWAGESPLAFASFFFWHAGYVIQKSLEGMLRNLLYQLARDHPELISHMMSEPSVEIPKLSPLISSMLSEPSDESPKLSSLQAGDPTLLELKGWFGGVVKASAKNDIPHRFCFLVDGLDECRDDEWELAEFLKTLAHASDHIKLITASRPHVPFLSAFASGPGLRLQDITRSDIRKFAADKLSSCVDEIDAADLIEKITTQSEGVFLWVSLVTGNLVSMFREGATKAEVQTELVAMPSEIGDLYQNILDRIPKAYRSEAAKMIQMIMALYYHDGSLDKKEVILWNDVLYTDIAYGSVMWSALEFGSKALTMQYAPMGLRELLQRETAFVSRLQSRCFGLLEVNKLAGSSVEGRLGTVDFVHRSCHEFFSVTTHWKALFEMQSDSSFSIDSSWFLGGLALWKLGIGLPTSKGDMVVHVLNYATAEERFNRPSPKFHLDEFARAFQQRMTAEGHISRNGDRHWSLIDHMDLLYIKRSWPGDGLLEWSHLRGHRLDSFMRLDDDSYHYTPLAQIRQMAPWEQIHFLRMDSLDISARDYLLDHGLTQDTSDFIFIALLNGLLTYTTQCLDQMDRGSRVATATRLMLLYLQAMENKVQSFDRARHPVDLESKHFDQLLAQGADPNYLIHCQVPLWAVLLVLFHRVTNKSADKAQYIHQKQKDVKVLYFAFLRFLDSGADISQSFYHDGREYASGLEYLEVHGPPTCHPDVEEWVVPNPKDERLEKDEHLERWHGLKKAFVERIQQAAEKQEQKVPSDIASSGITTPLQRASNGKGILKLGKKGMRAGLKSLMGGFR